MKRCLLNKFVLVFNSYFWTLPDERGEALNLLGRLLPFTVLRRTSTLLFPFADFLFVLGWINFHFLTLPDERGEALNLLGRLCLLQCYTGLVDFSFSLLIFILFWSGFDFHFWTISDERRAALNLLGRLLPFTVLRRTSTLLFLFVDF